MTELQDKLSTIDELSKAYQRIASIGVRSANTTRSQEKELLDAISGIVSTLKEPEPSAVVFGPDIRKVSVKD